jgi:diguanylate cyclase (GGDEF)-like protein
MAHALPNDDQPPADPRAEALAVWLSHARRRIDPRFPPAIERVWEAESTPERIRALKLATATACITAIVTMPLLWRLLSDSHAAIRALWIFGGIPVGLVSHLLLYTRLRVATQEWQITASGLCVGVLFTLLMAYSRYGQESLYFGTMVALIMLDAVAGRLCFRPAAVLVGGLTAIFAAGISNIPLMEDLPGLALIMLLVLTGVFALFGNWRLETEIRRSFALALRERLARQELAVVNAELSQLAGRDPLTGLANRRTYDAWLRSHWAALADTGGALGLIVIDVDFFKPYNDHYGHAAGDACLQTIARCLRDQSRGTTDQVARIGGEEFAVLLPGLTLDRAGDVAERLRSAIAVADLPHLGAPPPRRITISCGAASFQPGWGGSQADLFAAADAALYEAKQSGRNRVCLGEQPAPDPHAAARTTQAHRPRPVQSG